MARKQQFVAATVALALAALCVALIIAREPRHGLLLTHYRTENFTNPDGEPEIDRHIDFSTGDKLIPVPNWVQPHSSARWTGYIEIPRESDYTFRTTSDDGSWLYLDGNEFINNEGAHGPKDVEKETHLTQGYHAVRIDYFQDTGDATLKFDWKRSGNDSRLELVSPAMLYPAVPPPIGLPDRALRLAPWLLLLIAGWILRPRAFPKLGESIRAQCYAAAGGVFLLALYARMHGLLAEGETCDQWTYVSAGYVYARNVTAGFFNSAYWAWNYEHPTVGKLIYGFAQFVFGFGTRVPNTAAAIMSSLTVLTIFWSALRLFGFRVAVASSVILALIPPFVAHGRIAALDTPATFFFTLSISLLVRAVQDERSRQVTYLAMIVATGLGIATKFSNGLLLPVEGIAVLIAQTRWDWKRVTFEMPIALLGFPFTPFILLVATWPWIWTATFPHMDLTFGHWNITIPEIYFGGYRENPPVQYLIVSFLVITPALLFLPALIGIARLIIPGKSPAASASHGLRILMMAWFIAPFAWTLAGLRMGGIRYGLNAYPPFAILAGLGVVAIADWISRWQPIQRLAWPAITGVAALYLFAADASVHPYYLDYYNEILGGPAKVAAGRLMCFGWWGEGIDRAVDWMNEHAPRGATYSVGAWSPPGIIAARSDLKRAPSNSDFIVSQWFLDRRPGPAYRMVHEVTVQGAPIVQVFQRVEANQRSRIAL